MGVVYKALDTELGREVALKFLPTASKSSSEAQQRFRREAQSASALDHANICTIYEIGQTETGEQFIAMGYYEGDTLELRLRKESPARDEVLGWGVQLADALDCAHEAGIVHRDLKPANVLITKRGDVRLLDFGLAKLSSATQLTQVGTTLGTVHYMSPEQADARESDSATDVWSLGVILYRMLSGRLPFAGDNPAATLRAISEKDPDPLPDDVDSELAECVFACLGKRASERPSAAIVRDRLRAMKSGPTTVRLSTHSGPHSAPRRRLLGALAAVAVVALIAIWFSTRDGGSPVTAAEELDPNLLAITPFRVLGSEEHAYLSEGIIDLISTRTADIQALRVVDPRQMVGLVRKADVDVFDPESATAIARRLGAGRFVTGTILESGERVEIAALLYDVANPTPREFGASGTGEDLFAIVDALVAELLTLTLGSGSGPERDLAARTTTSLVALKAFLEGERSMRAGRYREAAEAYDRAVAEDSTFALAHLRKSLAADWTDGADIRASAETAYRLADQLPQAERDLAHAIRLRRNGRSAEAVQIFRSILHRRPDDVEALVQLGEALFHEGPRTGHSVMESMEPLRRAAEIEPTNLVAHIHLARLYALADSIDALQRTVDAVLRNAPESERRAEVEALAVFRSGDADRIAQFEQWMIGKPWYYSFTAIHALLRFGRNPDAAAELLELRRDEHPLLEALVPSVRAVRGQLGLMREFLASVRSERNPQWDLFECFLWTSGALPARDDAALAATIERLRRADAAELLSTSILPPYWDLDVRFAGFQRDFFVTLGLIQLGRTDEAMPILQRLEAQPAFEGLASLHTDATTGLRGEIAYQAGDLEEALRRMREVRCDTPHAATPQPMADAGRWRWLRAELELEVGDIDVARNYFLAFDESWSPWDSYHRPMAFRRLGEIAERKGRHDEAALWYRRLLEIWKDCDENLLPQREAIRQRLEGLI